MRATSKRVSNPRSKNLFNFQRVNAYGVVVATHRGRYIVQLFETASNSNIVTLKQTYAWKLSDQLVCSTRARVHRDTDIVPSDVVGLKLSENDEKNQQLPLGRIEQIVERKNSIMRTRDDQKSETRVIAANVDAVAIVVATTSPEMQPEFIWRVVQEALRAKVQPLLLITKSDLATFELQRLHNTIDYQFTQQQVFDVHNQFDELVELLQNVGVTVLVGLSGVGKSTLLNRLVPQAKRTVGVVSTKGDGRHTSTSSQAFQLPNNCSFIIDTPGIRSFGLGHMNKR